MRIRIQLPKIMRIRIRNPGRTLQHHRSSAMRPLRVPRRRAILYAIPHPNFHTPKNNWLMVLGRHTTLKVFWNRNVDLIFCFLFCLIIHVSAAAQVGGENFFLLKPRTQKTWTRFYRPCWVQCWRRSWPSWCRPPLSRPPCPNGRAAGRASPCAPSPGSARTSPRTARTARTGSDTCKERERGFRINSF